MTDFSLSPAPTLTLEESVRRIKQAIVWFPGLTLPCRRQSGKTTAILELIRERHDGVAVYLAPSFNQIGHAKSIYSQRWPGNLPSFATSSIQLLGSALPIYVDEYWMFSEKDRQILEEDFGYRIVCRLGTRGVDNR